MTNFEFYKDELLEITETGRGALAIVNDKLTNCRDVNCYDCSRFDSTCSDVHLIKWLLAEHIEETENYKICKNLKVDDKILVSDDGDYWERRHFARYDSVNDEVVAFDSGATSWSSDKTWVSHWKYVKLPEEEANDNT